jgi:GTP diphosphokinase / guanosine-3',5'-bis(diphosphate) 3'-diphosphatase
MQETLNNTPEIINQEEEEKLIIQRAYRKLLRCIKTDISAEDSKNIRQAYEIAVEAHSKQRRKSGEPYILHPIEVARICAEELVLGPTAIVAALLHDVVEDTDVTLDEIEGKFGKQIAIIVKGLTKLDEVSVGVNKQAENFKKILGTLIVDVRIALIKMADRMHNMRTLGSMPSHKQMRIAHETSYIYAPLAHRLGLYAFKTEFQDLCLKITHRDEYDEIANWLNQTRKDRNTYIDTFIKPISTELEGNGINFRIVGRPKSIYSIWNKIKTKHVVFEEIYDLFAIRIIIDAPVNESLKSPQREMEQSNREKGACWQAYSIVTSVHTPIPDRLKDWITIPKSNGYESLHTTVIGDGGRYVEVQIRSERMDDIAERGYAAHWKYKGVSKQNDVFEPWLESVREMFDKSGGDNSVDFVSDFRTNNLFTEEVHVYTPKGDMRVFPKGATGLDFAFFIHSNVGYQCSAIKINNKLVPMSYKLQSGDQVQVITNKNQKPTESWLKMVITGKARDKIRAALKEDQKKQGEYGKEALERKINHLKVDFDDSVEMITKHFGYKNKLELFYAISMNTIDLQDDLKVFKVEKNKLVLIEAEIPVVKKERTAPLKSSKPQLFINSEPSSQYEYQLATCCNAVHGDEVFAYISTNNIMKVHRATCKNAGNLIANFSYRILKAEWGMATNASFIAELLITGIDKGIGVIERLSSIISNQLGLNIRSFSIEGNDGYFEGRVRLIVANRDQLVLAIRALKTIEGVSNVTRVE